MRPVAPAEPSTIQPDPELQSDMTDDRPIRVRRALLSVSDKTGLVELGRCLARHEVEILSTGGSAKALLDRSPDPTETEIRYWLAGNMCRCTGYDKVVRAVQDAARQLRQEEVSR